jgi:flagellar L-ring protein precursor FlgH
MKKINIVSGLASVLILSGCSTPQPIKTGAEFAPTMPMPTPQIHERQATGGIYSQGMASSLLSLNRQYQVGDVVTVLLDESTQAERRQSANVNRKSSNTAIPQSLTDRLVKSAPIFAGVSLNENTIESTGSGLANQRASLNGSISVTVAEVLPNGSLVLRGEKQLTLSEGSEVIQVSGIVRSQDIAPNNTVQSRRLANARFIYRGEGDTARASQPGWGTRALLRVWPF